MSSYHAGEVPSDRVRDLIDETGRITETGELPKRIHNDEEVHALELERVFGESWILIGHETEIPEPGDYAKRYVADSPFIYVRDEEGEVRVLFDSCRHRGTTVVRAEQGNTTHSQCPYHNWTRTPVSWSASPARTSVFRGSIRTTTDANRPPASMSTAG
jgi:hypothetical protein